MSAPDREPRSTRELYMRIAREDEAASTLSPDCQAMTPDAPAPTPTERRNPWAIDQWPIRHWLILLAIEAAAFVALYISRHG